MARRKNKNRNKKSKEKLSFQARLPAELRILIWTFASLPDHDTPEICIWDPAFGLSPKYFGLGEDEEDGYMPEDYACLPGHFVLTGFPATMHVCHESRQVALKTLQFTSVDPGVSNLGLQVPCRAYKPSVDCFYVPPSSFHHFGHAVYDLSMRDFGVDSNGSEYTVDATTEVVLTQHEHFAVPATAIPEELRDFCEYHLGIFYNLCHLSVVFEPSTHDSDSGDFHTRNGRLRHMRLVQLPVRPGTTRHSRPYCPVEIARRVKAAEINIAEQYADLDMMCLDDGECLVDVIAMKLVPAVRYRKPRLGCWGDVRE